MIETRDSRNSRPLHQSPDRKHRGKQQQQQQKKADNYPSMMYGTLKGEDLLDNSGSSLDNINDGSNQGTSSTPQSVEMGQYSSSEYHQPLMNGTTATTTTTIQNNNGGSSGISPLSGLPPAIPLRRRADSSGDRSTGELSTVSGVSGHNRIHRTSSSDGYEQVLNNHYNNNSTTLSPGSTGNYYQSPGANNNYAIPPKPSMVPRQRSSNNTRPVRRRSRSPSPSHSTPGSSSINNGQLQQQQQQQQYYIGHPLHQRRPSEEYMMQNQNAQNNSGGGSSNRHRRTHSYDAAPQLLHRGNSSNSLYSMNSQGSMNSEQMKLLPDPRWGGGSGGSRTRSYSGDRVGGGGSQSIQMAGVQQMQNNGVGMSYSSEEYSSTKRTTSYSSDLKTTMGIAGSYSNDSQEQQQPQQVEVTSKLLYSNNNNVGGYGSIASVTSGGKEVISDMGEMQPLVRGNHHRRSNSEVSVSTYASGVSIDRSVEPVMTDMTKSVMFKGVTNKGVVKLQLPKDNFRLLSDRDLGEYCMLCF